MPAPILTQAASIMCPHGARAVVMPQNMTVQIMNSPVLVATDVFTIVGCPFVIAGAPAPCINIQWTAPSVAMKVNNVPVLLQTSVGLCIGGSGSVPAVVVPGQTQVLAT